MKEIKFEGKPYSALVFDTEEEIGRYAAEIVTKKLCEKPDMLLGLATGSTPVPLYRELVKACMEGKVSFKNVRTYNLDEYFPIDTKSPLSFLGFMRENLFDHIDLPEQAIHIPNGEAADADVEAARYEKELFAAGGVDIQVLGIGSDGHIGFNEPGDAYIYETHATDLTQQTIVDNSRFFNDISEVPTRAITMGIGAIMRAKQCLFIATGKNKAQAVKDALTASATPACQASILQFHPNTVFLLDKEAASLL